MIYHNYIDHPAYGRLWYQATLRNLAVMGWTAEQNRAEGPIAEYRLVDFSDGCSMTKDLSKIEPQLRAWLDFLAKEEVRLHPWSRERGWRERLRWRWSSLRLWWSFRYGRLRGSTNPVRLPTRRERLLACDPRPDWSLNGRYVPPSHD